jgi:D-alanyl-lipoteichoic acid acyltransferase DltB (MBOAT superfamily)
MLFNSQIFGLFLLIALIAYYSTYFSRRLQNIVLIILSYFFYGYWDWRFLILIFISTVVDFTAGSILQSSSNPKTRKMTVLCSIIVNLSILGFFKYCNFFLDSLSDILQIMGAQAIPFTLEILLPVGISFYTFQTMSYTIDVYRGRTPAAKSFIDFACYVSFFPQLVAGPIEKAHNFLPQVMSPRKFKLEQWSEGVYLILYGFFLKIFVADNMAEIADAVFTDVEQQNALAIFLGITAFMFQIYGDFSGYSKIARGVAKLMGFELMVNFNLPYFSRTPSEFWQRWHISLSSWLREYLYIPLGGNRKGLSRTYVNLLLTMLLGGLWHGAAWNFVLWGLYHGLVLCLYRACPWTRDIPKGCDHKSIFVRILASLFWGSLMLAITWFGWLLFRISSIDDLSTCISTLTELPTALFTELQLPDIRTARKVAFYVVPLALLEIAQRIKNNQLWPLQWPVPLRVVWYLFLLYAIILFGNFNQQEFLYFQF